ncbi:zinc finger protein 235-like isoform X1 [Periplaneta americana]|uniref:zinc finger protein 235-like isoform X1 n=2 Tax=Periplaneta americana TaxID=6978 RepID=UPI0037E7C096
MVTKFEMDVIKMEPDINPLAIQSNETEEKKYLSQEGNLLDLPVTRIKEEYVDDSYDHNPEIKFEEIILLKCEVEEDYFDLDRVQQQQTRDVSIEEDEASTESLMDNVETCVPPLHAGHQGNHERLLRGERQLKSDLSRICSSVSETDLVSYIPLISSKRNIYISSTTGHLKADIPIHTDGRSYNCDVCGKCFSCSGNLARHTRLHTGDKPFKCDVCAKCFSQSGSLKNHALLHTGERPFKCDVCGKCFSDRGNLKTHNRIHTGEKPFICNVCGNCFSQSGQLKRHALVHTIETTVKCDMCGKYFSCSKNLARHTRLHTGAQPFKCDVCGKCFSYSESLNTHVRIHTGERPYKCDVCGKCFSDRRCMIIHTRIHTGEKPFKCDVCAQCFSQSVQLKRHALVTHR